MNKNKYNFALFLTIIFCLPVFAQQQNPKKLLEAVKNKFNKIQDYTVDTKIKLNVELFKVPETTAKIYFKKPDKVKMEAKGFAMLPKQGLNFSPNKFLSDNFEAVYIKKEKIDSVLLNVVKVIPLSDTSDVLLSTIWIDSGNNVIRKIVSVTKKSGEITVSLRYDKNTIKYGVPVEMEFIFDADDLPANKKNEISARENQKQNRPKLKGTVNVYYSNYQINKGLSDEIFKKENSTTK